LLGNPERKAGGVEVAFVDFTRSMFAVPPAELINTR
jgi:hypothetical protein